MLFSKLTKSGNCVSVGIGIFAVSYGPSWAWGFLTVNPFNLFDKLRLIVIYFKIY